MFISEIKSRIAGLTIFVFIFREEDIEVLAVDGGKGGDETSPNRQLGRTSR